MQPNHPGTREDHIVKQRMVMRDSVEEESIPVLAFFFLLVSTDHIAKPINHPNQDHDYTSIM